MIKYVCKLTDVPRFTGAHLFQAQSGADHAYRVAMIGLLIVDHYNLKKKTKISREEVLMKCLIHDIEESVVGDIPTPVKYFSEVFREAVKTVEEEAMKQRVLIDSGPNKSEYYNLWKNAKKDSSGEIVKLADKLEALIKTNFEISIGNVSLTSAHHEFLAWFKENKKLLTKYPYAKVLYNQYKSIKYIK